LAFLWNLPTHTSVFLRGFNDFVENADLSKDYWNPKRKFGVTTHFSEIFELKIGKKIPYILRILKNF